MSLAVDNSGFSLRNLFEFYTFERKCVFEHFSIISLNGIYATDRSKISGDQNRIKFRLSL